MASVTSTPEEKSGAARGPRVRDVVLRVVGVTAVTILLGLAVVARQPFGGNAVDLDSSWASSLPYQWQQGRISGRDFEYTYGPGAQFLTAVAARLHVMDDPLSSVGLVYLVFTLSGVACLAVLVLMVPGLGGFRSTLAVALIWLTGMPLAFPSFRPWIVMVATGLAALALCAGSSRARALWACSAGVVCFVAQLMTGELLLYGVVGIVGFVTLDLLLDLVGRLWFGRGVSEGILRATLQPLGWILATVLTANAAIEIVFQATSQCGYETCGYLRSIFTMVSGYATTMSIGWSLDLANTAAVLAVIGWTAGIVVWRRIRDGQPANRLLLAWTCVAALLLKSSLVRSDLGHIALGLAPSVVLIVLGHVLWATTRRWVVAAVVASSTLLVAWPLSDLDAWRVGFDVVVGKEHPRTALTRLRSRRVERSRILSPDLVAWSRSERRPVAVVPYQNQIAVAARRPLVAPVLQAYAAHTGPQQRGFVESLERTGPALQVLWGLDDSASIRLDNVQTIARLPVIFEYLVTHFRAPGSGAGASGYLLLERRPQAATLARRQLASSWEAVDARRGRRSLEATSTCGLIALKVATSSPPWTAALQPAEIWVRVLYQDVEVVSSRVLPIEGSRTWETFLSTASPQAIAGVLVDGTTTDARWDAVEVFPVRGRFAVPPDTLEIESVSCVELNEPGPQVQGTDTDH